jgi:hypothetical protein
MCQDLGPEVRSHDEDGVPEVDFNTLRIGEESLIQNL